MRFQLALTASSWCAGRTRSACSTPSRRSRRCTPTDDEAVAVGARNTYWVKARNAVGLSTWTAAATGFQGACRS